MLIQIKMSKKEIKLIKKYAKISGTTVSDVVKKAILEKIEDEFDIAKYEKAYSEYEESQVFYTLEETKEILNIK